MKGPDILIYNPQGTNLYQMIRTRDKKVLGRMIVHPNINRQLEIDELTIYTQKRQGYGTRFLDYAKKLSQEYGYGGNLVLNASTTPYDPHNPPHIFYRKYGFTSDNKKMIKKIDKCIRRKKQLNALYTPQLTMYYPDNTIKKPTFFERIKRLFTLKILC